MPRLLLLSLLDQILPSKLQEHRELHSRLLLVLDLVNVSQLLAKQMQQLSCRIARKYSQNIFNSIQGRKDIRRLQTHFISAIPSFMQCCLNKARQCVTNAIQSLKKQKSTTTSILNVLIKMHHWPFCHPIIPVWSPVTPFPYSLPSPTLPLIEGKANE